jgi:hypothetical protein
MRPPQPPTSFFTVMSFSPFSDDMVSNGPGAKLETELLKLIKDLALCSSSQPVYDTRQELQRLLIRQVGCESYADTAKSLVDLFFRSAIYNNGAQQYIHPQDYAIATSRVLGIIPVQLRDWSRPSNGEPPVVGKELFRQLIVERARSYLQLARATDRRLSITQHSNTTSHQGKTTLSSLMHKEKTRLAEYIGELQLNNILPAGVVHEYLIKLLHSTSVPTPTSSGLEAACRLINTIGSRVHDLPWRSTLFNALEVIRQRDAKKLHTSLHLLLLVTCQRQV